MIRIEKVNINNPDLLALIKELNDFFNEEWGTEVAQSYQNHHNLANMSCAVVAYDKQEAIGCGCWKFLDEQTPEIKRMYVKPTSRGNGAAKEIIQALESDMREKGYQQAVLETGKDMLSAIGFYERNGYQIIPNYGEFIGDEWCICMKKRFEL
ncbi:GNAT family N-acetyltransferase [Enterococcus crotali]|uniref:GNAT family N-acetyltransferase n=1 Tax=Enterococcus crotali TaxID=1453587 RepID=UPI000B33B53E|nr:GNAT family N-acetyltransferase [Enterococcus crotali]